MHVQAEGRTGKQCKLHVGEFQASDIKDVTRSLLCPGFAAACWLVGALEFGLFSVHVLSVVEIVANGSQAHDLIS